MQFMMNCKKFEHKKYICTVISKKYIFIFHTLQICDAKNKAKDWLWQKKLVLLYTILHADHKKEEPFIM